MSSSARPRALAIYAKLLRLSSRLPAAEAGPARARIRAAFRAGARETAPAAVHALLADASASLGYLKIVTPRRAGDDADAAGAGAGGGVAQGRFVVTAAGDLVPAPAEGGGARAPVAGAPVLAAADVRRHKQLMQRFHFAGRR
jgi:hypothetical protein